MKLSLKNEADFDNDLLHFVMLHFSRQCEIAAVSSSQNLTDKFSCKTDNADRHMSAKMNLKWFREKSLKCNLNVKQSCR